MKLGDPETWLANHLDRVDRLGAHLGPNLLQLPPRWRRDTGRLDAFLSLAPERIRWAVEVRDPSWLHDDVFEVLARHRAALCIHDLLPSHPWLRTTDWTYVRFHAGRGTPRSCYEANELAAWAARLETAWGRDASAFVYFNNDGSGCALRDASVFAEVLHRRGVAVASLPRVSDAVLVDPGAFVADPEGRAPVGAGGSWGRTLFEERANQQPQGVS
jgi:uncharacterized protein YecE (DUF72 family)